MTAPHVTIILPCYNAAATLPRALAARQARLEHARGGLVCILDADDWICPWKIRVQAEALATHPELRLVSAGFAIVDAANRLVACRQSGRLPDDVEVRGPHSGRHPPAVPLGPVLFRAADGLATGFDPGLRRSADADFLQRLLHGHRYGVWGEPLAGWLGIARDALKLTAYQAALALGAGEWLRQRSSSPPTDRERERFEAARRAVEQRRSAA